MQFNILVSFAIVLGSSLLSSVAAGGFSNSCENISFVNPTLQADCGNGHGQTDFSQLNLDQCVDNNNGQLTCGGGFSFSCQNCILEGTSGLVCSCRTEAGNYESTSLDLDNCVTNNGGHLTC